MSVARWLVLFVLTSVTILLLLAAVTGCDPADAWICSPSQWDWILILVSMALTPYWVKSISAFLAGRKHSTLPNHSDMKHIDALWLVPVNGTCEEISLEASFKDREKKILDTGPPTRRQIHQWRRYARQHGVDLKWRLQH